MNNPPRVSGVLRRLVADRANRCCEYCQSQERFSMDPFSIDHVQPWSAGGVTQESNLAWTCLGCNINKADATSAIDPATGLTAPLFHPRHNRWADHFTWSDDGTRIVGITPAGRATVYLLQLNRGGLVNLRQVLIQIGMHPPVEDRFRTSKVE